MGRGSAQGHESFRHTHGQPDIPTHRQTDRQTDRNVYGNAHRLTHKHTMVQKITKWPISAQKDLLWKVHP